MTRSSRRRHAEPFAHRRLEARRHLVFVAGGVDQQAALRLTFRNVVESVVQTGVEIRVHFLVAVLAAGARFSPGEALLDGQIEDEGEVGLQAAGDERLQRLDGFAPQPLRIALIGHGRVHEAIADHPGAAGQGRLDGANDMVAARGEAALLRRLAGALAAFQGDEFSAHHVRRSSVQGEPSSRNFTLAAMRPKGPSCSTSAPACSGTSTGTPPGQVTRSLAISVPAGTGAGIGES